MIRKQLLTSLFLLVVFLSACGGEPVILEWDHSPEITIISLSSGGGMMAPISFYNDIPDAKVWGGGRIIWQTRGEKYERLVWEGQLSEAEMTGLLETFVDKGFFRLDAFYRPKEEIFDSQTTSLWVTLLETKHGVNEYHSGAPRQFHQLAGLLSAGAGAEGAPYVPQSGFLTAKPLSQGVDGLPVWDESAAGLSLADAEAGVWLEGESLAQAWTLVNQIYWRPRVIQGDRAYELYLQIPELTGREPEMP